MLARTLLFNVLFYVTFAVMAVALAPTMLLPLRHIWFVPKLWARVSLWLHHTICGVGEDISGLENIPEGGVLIASKHQSAWDTMMFHRFVSHSVYVTKQEVTRIPLYGAVARSIGSISIDRRGGAKALKGLIRDCRAAIEGGHQVIIFPEGTRTAPGTRLPYQPGVAAIYKQLDVTVVPVALNSGLFWGRRSFYTRPGCIVVEFLPAIQPGLDRKVFLSQLEATVEDATAALIAEAEAADPSP